MPHEPSPADKAPSLPDRLGWPAEVASSLPRRLGLWSAVAVLVGSTIGSGIFRVPAEVAQRIGIAEVFLLAWVVGGLFALFGALTLAELAAAFPRTGGIYVFIREGFGPLPAFLFGWAELVIIRPGAYGAIAITFAEYLSDLVPVLDTAIVLGPLRTSGVQLTAALGILAVAAFNYLGIHRAAIVQNATTVFKVAAVAALALLGLAFGVRAIPETAGAVEAVPAVQLGAFGVALIAILWAYDGWADLSFVAGEVREPGRNLPRALLFGTALVIVLYLLANVTYLYLIPIAEIAVSPLVAADAAERVFGGLGRGLLAGVVAVSTFGTLNGSMMTAPRIFFAMAEDGLFFRKIAAVHPRHRSPSAAVVLAAALGIAFVLVRTFAELAEQFIVGIWPFYALAVAAIFIVRRRRPDLPRPYRTWGYPVVPLLFLIASLCVLANVLVENPVPTSANFAVILAGVPVYYAWRFWTRRRGR
ncbi:MAG: amino acid permease [Gemmatimonadota bacterium]